MINTHMDAQHMVIHVRVCFSRNLAPAFSGLHIFDGHVIRQGA